MSAELFSGTQDQKQTKQFKKVYLPDKDESEWIGHQLYLSTFGF